MLTNEQIKEKEKTIYCDLWEIGKDITKNNLQESTKKILNYVDQHKNFLSVNYPYVENEIIKKNDVVNNLKTSINSYSNFTIKDSDLMKKSLLESQLKYIKNYDHDYFMNDKKHNLLNINLYSFIDYDNLMMFLSNLKDQVDLNNSKRKY